MLESEEAPHPASPAEWRGFPELPFFNTSPLAGEVGDVRAPGEGEQMLESAEASSPLCSLFVPLCLRGYSGFPFLGTSPQRHKDTETEHRVGMELNDSPSSPGEVGDGPARNGLEWDMVIFLALAALARGARSRGG